MGSLTINDRLGDFMHEMEPGAIYWEWSDDVRIAMHKDVYEYSFVDGSTTVYPYKKFIDMTTMSKDRTIRKILYKAYKNGGTWVNLLNILQLYGGDPYTAAESFTNSFIANIEALKSVDYTDTEFMIHKIEENDGDIHSGIVMKHIPISDETIFEIRQFNIDEPDWGPSLNHLKNDIKISIIDDDYDGDFDNVLLWLNGVFLPVIHDDSSNRIIYVKDAKSYVNSHVVDYKDFGEPVYKPGSWNGTIVIDPSYNNYRYDFDVKIFQWPGVEISPWILPTGSTNESFLFYDELLNITKRVQYTKELFFEEDINYDAHFLMLNGTVLNESYYVIDPDNPRHIILRGVNHHVHSMLESLVKDRDENPDLVTDPVKIVNRIFPGSQEYSIINFSTPTQGKKLMMYKSEKCLRNFPYPFHVTFADFTMGDLVLMDGVYERFVMHSRNSIEYPITKYMARFNDYNVLADTRIQRIYFYEKDI